MRIACNVHTHTNFCDGVNSAEEMVQGAIECGCKVLGFSGHSPVMRHTDWTMTDISQSEYICEILRLKEKYSKNIEILLGIEQDYESGKAKYPFDFVIGSVHAVEKNKHFIEVDGSPKELFNSINEMYNGDVMALVNDYYNRVSNIVNVTNCDIIGHFDLVTKFNEKFPFVDTNSKTYRDIAISALDALITKNKIFEINTGAISRGWRKIPYPENFLLCRLAERKANVMLTSDSHSKETILYCFDEAIEYAGACGIKELCVYNNKKIEKIKI